MISDGPERVRRHEQALEVKAHDVDRLPVGNEARLAGDTPAIVRGAHHGDPGEADEELLVAAHVVVMVVGREDRPELQAVGTEGLQDGGRLARVHERDRVASLGAQEVRVVVFQTGDDGDFHAPSIPPFAAGNPRGLLQRERPGVNLLGLWRA
jgi:hypothetical protein